MSSAPVRPPLFDNRVSVRADECAQNARDAQSDGVNQYSLFNMYGVNRPDCGDAEARVREFAATNFRTFRNGYGFANGCRIDIDSQMRNGSVLTNERYKTQLFPRVYQAIPDFGRGGLIPQVESRLVQGEDTAEKRSCDVLSEVSIDRFIPLIPCLRQTVQDPAHIVPSWTWGGEPTRDTIRQSEFLQCHGYAFDGVAWKKQQ